MTQTTTYTGPQAIAEFTRRVKAKLAERPNLSRAEACARIATADPELHREFLLATNSARGGVVARQISEKFEPAEPVKQ